VAAEFAEVNASAVSSMFHGRTFDIIIFFAALEHMTHGERLTAMKSTWELLPRGGLWCIIETPNRLWYFDGHTSLLPFYLWLPDDLAFAYSRYSPRSSFKTLYREATSESFLDFLRRGRGLSFHEFDLAMGKAENLKVVSSLETFRESRSLLWRLLQTTKGKHRYMSFLKKQGPGIHEGFYRQDLNLIIEKT
jgi:S-adenosylmethionine-dependent methyltransferase